MITSLNPDVPFKWLTPPIVDLSVYKFKDLNTGNITPEESFTNSYTEEIHELKQVRSSNKQFYVILDAKYENSDLNKVMKNKCQHFMETQRNELLKLLQKIEDFFDGTLGTWKTYTVDLLL